jgi:hypothetical protein
LGRVRVERQLRAGGECRSEGRQCGYHVRQETELQMNGCSETGMGSNCPPFFRCSGCRRSALLDTRSARDVQGLLTAANPCRNESEEKYFIPFQASPCSIIKKIRYRSRKVHA